MTVFFNRASVYAVCIVLPCAASLMVLLRFFVRRSKGTAWLSDDWVILAALALTWALGIILIAGDASDVFGAHSAVDPTTGADAITSANIYDAKSYYAYVIIFILAIGLVKISVLLFYRRIFVNKGFRQISLGLLVLMILWTTAFFLARTFTCGTHFTAFWESGPAIAKYCFSYQDIEFGFAISDVVTDLMVLATPLHYIWQLQMSLSKKVGVSFIFLLGLLSTASAIVRLVFLTIEGFESTPGYRDVIGIDTNVLTWSQVEAGVGIIAACLPTLRPLFMGKAPESIINSLRSALSLNSLTSSVRRRMGTHTGNTSVGADPEDASKLVHDASNPGMNTKATKEAESHQLYNMSSDRILVQNSFRPSDEGNAYSGHQV